MPKKTEKKAVTVAKKDQSALKKATANEKKAAIAYVKAKFIHEGKETLGLLMATPSGKGGTTDKGLVIHLFNFFLFSF